MAAVPTAARRERWGLRGDRADVIVPAMFVLSAVAERVGCATIAAPGVGLKDGILAELVDRAFRVWDERGEQAEVEAEAVELGKKYRFDEAHARHVAELAASLFDQLADLHHMGPDERRLLRLSALLHDIGDFVGFESHHKHTYYLIQHADLMGLSPSHKEVVANVARYHRKSLPDLSHPGYRKLDRRERAVVRKLAALLRVADAFDREHQGKVLEVAVRLTPGRIALRAVANPRVVGEAALSLERWTALRKADLMEDVFECDVKVDGAEGVAPPRAML
jgi:exopolyphosphatase/guanosine-5'-triphosphate,3'-diphosphate pyrophosphatase